MSHYDKKFEDESQDARRNARHDEIHPDDKLEKHRDEPTNKDKLIDKAKSEDRKR